MCPAAKVKRLVMLTRGWSSTSLSTNTLAGGLLPGCGQGPARVAEVLYRRRRPAASGIFDRRARGREGGCGGGRQGGRRAAPPGALLAVGLRTRAPPLGCA